MNHKNNKSASNRMNLLVDKHTNKEIQVNDFLAELILISADSPYIAEVWYNIGRMLEKLAINPILAITFYEKAVSLNPNFSDAHYCLFILFEKTDNVISAIKHARLYLKTRNKLENPIFFAYAEQYINHMCPLKIVK